MKVILFDLGNTLEHTLSGRDTIMPGALELLSELAVIKDKSGTPPVLALVSDYQGPSKEYYHLVDGLGFDKFFKPYEQKITLSNEVGFSKPDSRIFRAAIDKIETDLPYYDVVFVTENKDHIKEARKLGMMAIRFKVINEFGEGVENLPEMVHLIHLFILT
jgi:FMN phosphatase YigB (HAD superfamily)